VAKNTKEMSHAQWSVWLYSYLFLSVCVFVATVSRAKTDEPIEMLFDGRLARNHVCTSGGAHWQR